MHAHHIAWVDVGAYERLLAQGMTLMAAAMARSGRYKSSDMDDLLKEVYCRSHSRALLASRQALSEFTCEKMDSHANSEVSPARAPAHASTHPCTHPPSPWH